MNIKSTLKKGMLTLTMATSLSFMANAQVKIAAKSDVTPVEASAALELKCTDKGFLPPRATTAQIGAVASPAEGLMMFDTDKKSLMVRKAAGWNKVANGADAIKDADANTGIEVEKTANEDFIRLSTGGTERMVVQADGKVKIGAVATAAETDLDVEGTEGTLVKATFGSGITKNLGAGTRMHFYGKKAAFRAGDAGGSQWNDANIGNYSTATGYRAIASGISSTASGSLTIASGNYAAAFGNGADATGQSSFAAGQGTEAAGTHSVAFGNTSKALGNFAVATGRNSNAAGESAVAMGYFASAAGKRATSFGSVTDAAGDHSFASGLVTSASSFGETVIGLYNTTYTPNSATAYDVADRLFVVGNGTAGGARSNALVMLKNGNTGFGVDNPTHTVHIKDCMKLEPSTAPASPSEGTIYFDSTSKKLRCYNGTTWNDLY